MAHRLQGLFIRVWSPRRSLPSPQPAGALRTIPLWACSILSHWGSGGFYSSFPLRCPASFAAYRIGRAVRPSICPRRRGTRFSIMCFPLQGAAPGLPRRCGRQILSVPDTANRFPVRRSSAWGICPVAALYFTQVSFSRSPAGFYPRHRGRGPPHGRASG